MVLVTLRIRTATALRDTVLGPHGRTDIDRRQGQRMPRLADIAKQADVSEATVSRVLNGRPGVAESIRQAVLTALDILGYDRPSRLRRASAGLVGLILPELTNPIFPAFAQVIETALVRQGFTPVLCTHTPGGVHEDD
jgi:DNA-binding LacI/PurR family transcriptional regulator